jgi:hypothetical protein
MIKNDAMIVFLRLDFLSVIPALNGVQPMEKCQHFFTAKAFHMACNQSARASGSSHPRGGSSERKIF